MSDLASRLATERAALATLVARVLAAAARVEAAGRVGRQ